MSDQQTTTTTTTTTPEQPNVAQDPPKKEEEETLPPLSQQEFRRYNRLSTKMDAFHNHFRQSWTEMHTACRTSKRPHGMSLRQFLAFSLDFCAMLNMHHGIEERHIFPNLARRMPAFRNNDLMKTQHKEIHAGLDKLQKWLEECKTGEREFRASEMLDIMDSFNDVLWKHLDEEVVQLGAENMRKYWTIEEIDRLGF
ncbi:hypothetical protein NP233_g3478 [Leucocoprinus birnbaumii]|uniref:Hemerythrin-like domain-containing protein n=1 Tax=Leucocoprinus birnbaumii TaxID=56174 RepID=A0AAD5VZ26_9AGAR|nr:hypothetical protein NP233_g3478 [Leucocoprinus birnbaumii]